MTKIEETLRDAVFGNGARGAKVECNLDGSVEVSQMYEYVDDDVATDALQSVTGVEYVLASQSAEAGCETCDYGSRYTSVYVTKAAL